MYCIFFWSSFSLKLSAHFVRHTLAFSFHNFVKKLYTFCETLCSSQLVFVTTRRAYFRHNVKSLLSSQREDALYATSWRPRLQRVDLEKTPPTTCRPTGAFREIPLLRQRAFWGQSVRWTARLNTPCFGNRIVWTRLSSQISILSSKVS